MMFTGILVVLRGFPTKTGEEALFLISLVLFIQFLRQSFSNITNFYGQYKNQNIFILADTIIVISR